MCVKGGIQASSFVFIDDEDEDDDDEEEEEEKMGEIMG